MDCKWYHWFRAPESVKAAVLAFIAERKYRISAGPSPILVVHPTAKKLYEFVPEPLHSILEGMYDTEIYVPYEDGRMIAVWCRQLEPELKDA